MPLPPVSESNAVSAPANTTILEDSQATLQWEKLTDLLADTDVLYNKFETQFKAFLDIYKEQELDPKPLNKAIWLFANLSKEALKTELNEDWNKLKQSFLQKLALFIDSNLTYKPIDKDTAVINFQFLLTYFSSLQSPLEIKLFPLVRYALSIFLEEKVNDKSQNLSGYDVFPWEKFREQYCENGLIDHMSWNAKEIISPYLRGVPSHNIDENIISALIDQTLVLKTVDPFLFKESIIQNIIQSLQQKNLLNILVVNPTTNCKTCIIALLDRIRSLKKEVDEKRNPLSYQKYAEESVPYETELEILQKRYNFIMDAIIKSASDEVKMEAITIDILHNSDYSSESLDYTQDDIIARLKTAYKNEEEFQKASREIIKEITRQKAIVLQKENDTTEKIDKERKKLVEMLRNLNKKQNELDRTYNKEKEKLNKEKEKLDKLKKIFTRFN